MGEEVGLGSWQDAAAVDRTEWVAQIRTVTTLIPPYQLQEASHAGYRGGARDAQLPPVGLQQRRGAGRPLHARGQRTRRVPRAEHGAGAALTGGGQGV